MDLEVRTVKHLFKAKNTAGPGLECCSPGLLLRLHLLPHFTQLACSGKGDSPSLICSWNKISTTMGNTPGDRNITKPLFCVNTSLSSLLSNQSELLSPCLKRQGHLIHNNFLFPFSQRLYSIKHDGSHSAFACQREQGQGSARTERILPLPTQRRRMEVSAGKCSNFAQVSIFH